ncbi:hypothetical protein [Thermus amyloliquefaciens]|uniref:hypothetical protein n=1 Tax=Thermus amyloliquefaciens TaxID=1449080 RepID=UPI0005713C94|nr:hypothetical protein [Thermus amyloliquefaciens]
MPLLLELLLLLVVLLLLALLLRPRPAGLEWTKAQLKSLVDWAEVERALRALDARERELEEALKAPHLFPETRGRLEAALGQTQRQRAQLLALLESLAAERALARKDLGAAKNLEERLAALREVLANLRERGE